MTTSRIAGRLAIATVALGLAVAGCGSDSDTGATSSSQSRSATTTTTTEAETTTTSSKAAGANYTIVDYIRDNRITEVPVHRGDPGAPQVNLPVPQGWEVAGSRTLEWAYGAIVSSDPALAQDPPTVIAIMSKLTGNVDPAKIIEFAPGELKNLPGYDGPGEGEKDTLGGFDAYQLGGTYDKDGAKRLIAQKTVVIPAQDGLYVLQLNADGLEDQAGQLIDATSEIDDKTTITP